MFEQRAENAAPVAQVKKCPKSCTCHKKQRSTATKNGQWTKKEHGAPVKVDLRKTGL